MAGSSSLFLVSFGLLRVSSVAWNPLGLTIVSYSPLNFDGFCAQVFIFVEVDISLNADTTLSRPIDPDALRLIVNAHKSAGISAWL